MIWLQLTFNICINHPTEQTSRLSSFASLLRADFGRILELCYDRVMLNDQKNCNEFHSQQSDTTDQMDHALQGPSKNSTCIQSAAKYSINKCTYTRTMSKIDFLEDLKLHVYK